MNDTPKIWTLWTVFARTSPHNSREVAGAPEVVETGLSENFQGLTDQLQAEGITLRGIYDVSAMRAQADVMVWLIGESPEGLQAAVRKIRRHELFTHTEITWSAMGVHRQAEFAKDHIPSYLRPELGPKAWLCVYPFVRSYDWYLLPDEERGKMLRDHGLKGREYPQVQANTVSAFALGDWEWLLGLEADQLADLVDLMRHLRATDARNHVREEIPFYTGRRITAAELSEVLRCP